MNLIPPSAAKRHPILCFCCREVVVGLYSITGFVGGGDHCGGVVVCLFVSVLFCIICVDSV